MGQTIVVDVPHQLGKVEAKRRIQEGFDSIDQLKASGLPATLSFTKRWDGDKFYLEASGLGQKISSMLQIFDHSVKIDIELPSLLAALGAFIKTAITKQTVKALEHSKS